MASEIAKLFVSVGADIKGFVSSMAAVDAQSKAAAAKLKRNMLIAGGAVVTGLGFAVKAAANFESSLHDMEAVSGATEEQMKQVSATAKRLGADIRLPGTSAADAADAMVQLAKGGLSVDQSMSAVRGTLLLSAAAQIENAQAATIVANALNSFGLEGKDASKVSDLLAASANASTAEISDMAMSLQQSSAVAKMAKFSIEDTVTALSMLANAGIRSSDAGTSLKTMLLRLIAPVGEGAKTIKGLNLQLRDQEGNLKRLPALATEFQSKMQGMTQAQRDQTMAAIFGSDAIRAGNILLSQGAQAFDTMRGKVTEVGAAQKLADAKMKGFNGALEAFKSALETAAISVGGAFLPALTEGVRGVAAFISGVSESRRAGEILQGVGQTASAAMEMLKTALGSVVPLIGTIVQALGALSSSAAGPVVLGLTAAATAAYFVVKAFMQVKMAMQAMTATMAKNPFGLLVIGAGALLGAIGGMTASMSRGKSVTDQLRDSMRGAAGAATTLAQKLGLLRDSTLDQRQAELNLRQAQAERRNVQAQIADGALKGAAAERALEQANINVARAQNEVKRATDNVKDARVEGVRAGDTLLKQTLRSIDLAGQEVQQLQTRMRITPGATGLSEKLAAAQSRLNALVENGAKKLGISSGQLQEMAKQGGPAAEKMLALASSSAKWGTKLAALQGQLQSIQQAAPAANQAAQQIGSAISLGIAQGIRDSKSVATAAAAQAAREAVAAGAAATESRSPSRLSAREIGEPLSQGIAVGIGQGKAGVLTAMTELAKSMRTQARLQSNLQRQEDVEAARQRGRAIRDAEEQLAAARAELAKKKSTENIRAVRSAEEQLTAAQLEVRRAGQQKVIEQMTRAIDRQRELVDQAKDKLSGAFSRLADKAFQVFDDATERNADKIRGRFAKVFADLDAEARAASDKLSATFDAARARISRDQQALTPAEQMLKDIEDLRAAQSRAQAVTDAAAAVAKARAEGDSEALLRAQRDLDEARLDQGVAALEAQARIERQIRDAAAAQELTALEASQKAEQDALDASFATRRQTLQDQMDEELRIFVINRAIERALFEAHLKALETQYAQGRITAAQANAGIRAELASHGVDFLSSGDRLGQLFAQGLRNSINEVAAAANAVARAAAAPLRLRSPAEVGPLSTLDKWWDPFVPTLTAGLDLSGVTAAGTGLAGAMAPGHGSPGGGATVIVNVSGNTLLGDDRSMARELARRIQPELNRLITMRTG